MLAALGVCAASRVEAQQPGQATDHAAKDPNYRWHNGQWWYWMPARGGWLMWNGSQWQPAASARTGGATRAYSYQPGSSADAALFGPGYSAGPQDVGNRQVLPSYGLRSAGSKVSGNY
jgi:hypothetical protein